MGQRPEARPGGAAFRCGDTYESQPCTLLLVWALSHVLSPTNQSPHPLRWFHTGTTWPFKCHTFRMRLEHNTKHDVMSSTAPERITKVLSLKFEWKFSRDSRGRLECSTALSPGYRYDNRPSACWDISKHNETVKFHQSPRGSLNWWTLSFPWVLLISSTQTKRPLYVASPLPPSVPGLFSVGGHVVRVTCWGSVHSDRECKGYCGLTPRLLLAFL